MSASVEQELWNIFTYYTLHGNPLDPNFIQSSQFLKFCRKCKIFDTNNLAHRPLTPAQLTLITRAETVKRSSGGGAGGGGGGGGVAFGAAEASSSSASSSMKFSVEKLSYSEFLTSLLKISQYMYECEPSGDGEMALQQLLMDHVLPLAHRRQPLPADVFLDESEIVSLEDSFRDSLALVFRFYAAASAEHAREKAVTRSAAISAAANAELGATSSRRQTAAAAAASSAGGSGPTDLSYAEYLRFCHDFGMLAEMGLTTLECGDIFLSTISVRRLARSRARTIDRLRRSLTSPPLPSLRARRCTAQNKACAASHSRNSGSASCAVPSRLSARSSQSRTPTRCAARSCTCGATCSRRCRPW